MKKTICLILLFCAPAFSYIITDQDNETIESINPFSTDTLIIASGDTVQIVDSWHALDNDTTCLLIYVRQGGVIEWTGGARANFGALWLGGKSNDPFNSEGGGKMYMGANDTLGLWNINLLGGAGAELQFRGSDCEIHINGQSSFSKAVIMGMSTSPGTIIIGDQSNGIFEAEYCKFYRIFDPTYTGLFLGISNPRDNNQQKIEKCLFDSAGIEIGVVGEKLANDTFYTYINMPTPIDLRPNNASQCTVWNCLVLEDNSFEPDSHQGTSINIAMDSVLIYGTTIRSTNTNGEGGRGQFGIDIYNVENCTIRKDTIDAFVWGIMPLNVHDLLIDSCVIINCTHEGILHVEGSTSSDWTIQANVFYNNGFMDFLWNQNTTRDIDLDILYNTFASYHPDDGAGHAITFRNHYGPPGIAINGVTVVGNICIGMDTDISIMGASSVAVIFDEFKYNAYDFMYLDNGCEALIRDSAYNIADSNLNEQSQYGFVDSTAYDIRLAGGSPMLNAGDSTFWASVFYPQGSDDDPGNIGYYQGPGVGGVTRIEIDRKIMDFREGRATLQEVLDLIELYNSGD